MGVTVHQRRSVRLPAAVILSAVLMTGCVSRVPGQPVTPAGSDGAPVEVFEQVDPPTLGSCLDTVHGGGNALSPPATVDCASPHGAEIAKVVEIPESLRESYPTEADLDSPAWAEVLYGDDGCGEYLLDNHYLGARDQDNLLTDVFAWVPKRVAWDGGAAWVACVVEYEPGADANAPGRIAQAMRGPDAASFRECWFGPEVVYDRVPCSQPHDAEPTGESVYPDENTPFPADPLARQPLVEECAASAIDYLERDLPSGFAAAVYLPTPADWALFPSGECVILDASGSRWTGSAVDA